MININNTPWDKLTKSDIQALIDGFDRETFFFEFKSDEARNETLQKEISAFANTYGGYILLGISDNKTISGCTSWTEERIHNAIYNGISPTPDFDVKSFGFDQGTVFVIKIEEGSMPPYITKDGKIFERVSSSSMPIKDSAKLSHLYSKHTSNLAKLNNKIGIEELRVHQATPHNLCGYLDLGFEVKCMDKVKVTKAEIYFDYTKIAGMVKDKGGTCGISNLGYSRLITFGDLRSNDNAKATILAEADMHNFIVIMNDGSVKCRICLFAEENGKVEISTLLNGLKLFQDIYGMIFKESLDGNFIYARKYEKLVVIKQFTPYFKAFESDKSDTYLQRHISKYGSNLIVSGNRIPHNDYDIIDRRYFDIFNKDFSIDVIISELFHSAHIILGYIDPPKKH